MLVLIGTLMLFFCVFGVFANNDRPNMAIGGITPAMKLKMAA